MAKPDEVADIGFSRRQLLRGGAIGAGVAGAAWVAPTVLTLDRVGAQASAGCPQVLDWDLFAVGSTFTSTSLGGVTVSLGTSLFTFAGGAGTAAVAGNRSIVAGPQGGIAGNALRITQDAVNLSGQEVTFTFSAPVTNVTFIVTDIDTSNGNWSDRVAILTTPFTGSALGANVIGVGANNNTFTNSGTGPYRTNVNSNIPPTSGAGNVTISIPGPTTTVVLRFWCGTQQGSTQLINILDMSFNTC